jgi:tRNA(Ile)-lysidine synthase
VAIKLRGRIAKKSREVIFLTQTLRKRGRAMPHFPLPGNLESALAATWPVDKWSETRQLVAVSGGADSVALLCAMARLAPNPERLDAAHFNHGWRGAESDADERFVRQLCAELGVRLIVGHASQVSEREKNEENARNARYEFLIQTAYQTGARYVVTAHTADDRVETVLHNLFRGTGLAGVAAPTLHRPLDGELVLVRPLIGSTRAQIIDYLEQIKQRYRVDSSNADTAYRRNYIRQELLPLLRQQYGPQLDAKLLSFSELAEETLATLQMLADDYLCQVQRTAQSPIAVQPPCLQAFSFPTSQLLPSPWPVVREALRMVWLRQGWPLQAMSRAHWEQVRNAHASAQARMQQDLPGGLRLCLNQGWISIFVP